MHPSLQKLFAIIELQRKETLDSISQLTNEQLNKSPAAGKWSIAQILSHLISGERLSLQYIQKKIQGAAHTENTGLVEEAKMILLKISQRIPGIKFKAPRGLVENTPIYKDFASLSHEWDLTRDEFKGFLDAIPETYLNKKIYKHPRAGYLNIKHALIFFREHIIHHTPQIKKLL